MRILLSSVVLSSIAIAQDPAQGQTPAAPVVHGAFGIDFTNQYFFRGILQENQGIIAQPWWQLGYGLYEDNGSLGKLGLTFGQWNSLHDGPSGSGGGNQGMWYRSDFHVGLEGTIGERLVVGTTYAAYHSPNGRFSTVEELIFSAKYDDRDQLLDSLTSGLQLKAELAFELDGQSDGGSHTGIYLGLGIEPSFTIGTLGEHDVKLAVPVTLGLSLADYYEDNNGSDDFFGYLDVGAVVSAPLSFLPSRMGPWDGHVGLHWLLLGDNNQDLNAGDTGELVFSFGLSTKF